MSLKVVAYYGNYTIILDKLGTFVSNLLNSTGAGVGNLIAEGNKDKICDVFWELFAIRFWFASIIAFATYFLVSPFIELWLGKEYLLPNVILLLILVRSFMSVIRGATDQFLYGYGLFYDTWAPIAETVILIVIAVAGGYFWGLSGVLLGGVVSLIAIVGVWKPYFLFSKGFKQSIWKYWYNWAIYSILCIISGIVSYFVIYELFPQGYASQSWLSWIVYSIILTLIYAVLCGISLYAGTRGMKSFVGRIWKMKK